MKYILIIPILLSKLAFAETRTFDVTVPPHVEGSFCKYDTTLSFNSFPDYEILTNVISNSIWRKSEDRVFTTVEETKDGHFDLRMQPTPEYIAGSSPCREIRLKVLVR